MENNNLATVLDAIRSGHLANAWERQTRQIQYERSAVDSYLSPTGKGRAYGFTSLLGQLDKIDGDAFDQANLLEGHLIGQTIECSSQFNRALSAVKLHQLSMGGSGISGETYRKLLDSFGSESDLYGAFLDSYGAGDVVPAAWWIRGNFTSADIGMFQRGDLICLLNGNFVSTAESIELVCALKVAREYYSRFVDSVQARLADFITVKNIQLPVAVRDFDPIWSNLVSAQDLLESTVDRSLSSGSFNPMFSLIDDQVSKVQSSNSFLNIELSAAIHAVIECICTLSVSVQRALSFVCESTLESADARDNLELVQAPKVALAQVIRVQESRFYNGLSPYVVESGKVEDFADGALLSGWAANCAITKFIDLVDFASRCLDNKRLSNHAASSRLGHWFDIDSTT